MVAVKLAFGGILPRTRLSEGRSWVCPSGLCCEIFVIWKMRSSSFVKETPTSGEQVRASTAFFQRVCFQVREQNLRGFGGDAKANYSWELAVGLGVEFLLWRRNFPAHHSTVHGKMLWWCVERGAPDAKMCNEWDVAASQQEPLRQCRPTGSWAAGFEARRQVCRVWDGGSNCGSPPWISFLLGPTRGSQSGNCRHGRKYIGRIWNTQLFAPRKWRFVSIFVGSELPFGIGPC